MALVVFLRGVNVGGHRTFRPTVLVSQLKHLEVVNVGAAGTFVVRRPVPRAKLRAELARRLPFETEIMICDGREIVTLVSREYFADYPARADVIRFVSILSRRPRVMPPLPLTLPDRGMWMVTVLGCEGRLAVGVYRRHMRVLGHLGALDRVFGAPVTIRGWNTITAITKILDPSRDAG
jgi:uncharacterized protein (DUF1697 family)